MHRHRCELLVYFEEITVTESIFPMTPMQLQAESSQSPFSISSSLFASIVYCRLGPSLGLVDRFDVVLGAAGAVTLSH